MRRVDLPRRLRLLQQKFEVLVIHLFEFVFERLLHVEVPSVGVAQNIVELVADLDENRFCARFAPAVKFRLLMRFNPLVVGERVQREASDLHQILNLVTRHNISLRERQLVFPRSVVGGLL